MNDYKYILKIIILFIVLLGFTGCNTGIPSFEEQARADYGQSITNDNARQLAEGFFQQVLKDPTSAQYKWNKVHRGFFRAPLIMGAGVTYGYILYVSVNAKNSYGGYTGYSRYSFLFRDSRITQVYEDKKDSYGNIITQRIY